MNRIHDPSRTRAASSQFRIVLELLVSYKMHMRLGDAVHTFYYRGVGFCATVTRQTWRRQSPPTLADVHTAADYKVAFKKTFRITLLAKIYTSSKVKYFANMATAILAAFV